MAQYLVTTTGAFYRAISEGSRVTVSGVTLIPDPDAAVEARRELRLRVQATVEAQDTDEAIRQGLDRFEAASGASRLVFDAPFDYRISGISTTTIRANPATGTHLASATLFATAVVEQAPIDSKDLANAAAVNSRLASLSAAEERRISLALRWYQRGLIARDVSDQLISLWIGFEALTDSSGTVVQNAVAALTKLYPGAKAASVEKVVRPIYKARNELFHKGDLNWANIGKRAQELATLYADLLAHEIGAPVLRKSAQLLGTK